MGKFKVGDLIKHISHGRIRRVLKITADGVYCPVVGGTKRPEIYIKYLNDVQLGNYKKVLTFKDYYDESRVEG